MSFHGQERIVLGHKISRKIIEVDSAKIEAIEKLNPPYFSERYKNIFGSCTVLSEVY